MGKGFDANVNVAPHLDCLRQHGYTFACRYLKAAGQPLTRPEAEAISAAGLYIVTVVEKGFPTTAGYFSRAKGEEDGRWAAHLAASTGQPAGSACYFACDYDAAPEEIHGGIQQYFEGIHEAFEKAGAPYSVGVYGSGAVCSHLLTATPTTHTWLAMSRGWRGSRAFAGWNLVQTVQTHVCSIVVDEDESRGNGGGWRL